MSYQVKGGSIRSTIDSRDSYRGSFRNTIESSRDSCTSFGNQVIMDKICLKLNQMDQNNAKIRQQLMGLAKISKDIKSDIDKYSHEITTKKTVGTKQRTARIAKAEKRETRHRQMRQGINDMLHE